MFLGLLMPQLLLPLWCKVAMATYIIFHLLIEFILSALTYADKGEYAPVL